MGATNELKKRDIQLLIEDLNILPFDQDVAFKASEIYHNLKKDNLLIEFRDIFIAATCIVHDLELKTFNKNHFKRIKELTLKT